LILTGQRRGEIASLKWDYVNPQEQTITLPASLTKNGRQHTFPYGQRVADVLAAVPNQADYLFPAARSHVRDKPTTVFNGWPKAKATFDARLDRIAPWTLHDLRRTFSSNLAAIGIAPHITERLLNHVSGKISGIAAIYNRHSYMDEMRAAIDAWEAKLASLVAG
jgi:integrase